MAEPQNDRHAPERYEETTDPNKPAGQRGQ